MLRTAKLVTGALLALCLAAAAWAQETSRHAFVVGNASYGFDELKNPVNDARAMAATLLDAGFRTTLIENATAAEFDRQLDAFLAGMPDDSVALFYYAGHALQRGGRNYLLPVDLGLGNADQVVTQSADVSRIVERFHDSGADFGIFILDSCRDNPFVTDGSEFGRGMASMESQAGETLIGFATQAGHVAYDGTGPNSPYTGALVSELEKEGRDILDVFRSVRRSVRIWTGGKQRPFISASIERRFVFRDTGRSRDAGVAPGAMTFDTVRPVIERIWWNAIEGSRVAEDYRAFVRQFPASEMVPTARNLLSALESEGIEVRGLSLAQFSLPPTLRSPNGLSAVITSCDVVAGDPDDPQRITDGVPWGLVNTRQALRECAEAVAADPTNPRLLHLTGRVLDILNRHAEAEAFYRLAGASGYSAALVNLGFLYVTGAGRERDYGEAYRLYRQAADLGNQRARTNIGEMFQRGWFVEKNPDEAVLWYRLAAQNGWPNALDTLANLYRQGRDSQGRGLDKDPQEALRLYRIASELGNTNAMNNLGQLYISGELGAPDVEEGLEWLARATELGNRFAPYSLGRLYRDGSVIERDFDRAIGYFEQAADLGFAPARIALGRMFQDGNGVPKDAEEAAFHYVVASLTADPKRPRQKEEALERLGKLGLDATRLEAVTARAEEWVRLNGG